LDATTVLSRQLKQSHDMIEGVIADLSAEDLHHRGEGTIESIAAIYAHTVMGEDELVNGFLREQPTVLEAGDWRERIGYGFAERGMLSADFARTVAGGDFQALRDYAQQVYATTDAYLAGLTASDLDRIVTFGPMGDMPVGSFIGEVLVWHAIHHTGEVCALKGCLGHQGLPF
jgi:uncharacterized damage-inducible protein DinB